MSTLALCLFIALLIATGVFYVAHDQYGHGAAWAMDVCWSMPKFCEMPHYIAIATGVTLVVYLGFRSGGL